MVLLSMADPGLSSPATVAACRVAAEGAVGDRHAATVEDPAAA